MAALVEWNDTLSLKIKEIDDQHKILVNMINDLHQAMLERKSAQVLGDIINGLINYTKTHFSNEEKYFLKFEYREAVAHKLAHKKFVDKVQAFKADFSAGKMMLSMEILAFLKDWLIEHIMGVDAKYVPLFKENGLA
jgi:hemerythrin